MRVVEEDEAERLLTTGVWFDSPLRAKNYRKNVEDEIKQESKVVEIRPKTKGKGKYK
jgi:hypothetical protein